jgi:hypothetical protein
MQRDPLGYVQGLSQYCAYRGLPLSRVDARGRCCTRSSQDPQAPDVTTEDCGGWVLQDGTHIDLTNCIRSAVQASCGTFDCIGAGMSADKCCMIKCLRRNPSIADAVKNGSIGDAADAVRTVLNDLKSTFCDPSNPHTFKCRDNSYSHCGNCSGGPGDCGMLTPPGFLGGFEGQPIVICTDNIDSPSLIYRYMTHEMLRQWFGGVVNEGWDVTLDVAKRCAPKCGASCGPPPPSQCG